MRATNVEINDKRTLVCGYCGTSQGYTFAPHGAGARVLISELIADTEPPNDMLLRIDVQAVTMEYAAGEIDIFTT
eukprot:11212805-Heterocapsa_arctica.AAC.1